MPLIKLSQGFSDIKGKANGSVFAENGTGKYFRNNNRLVGTPGKGFSIGGAILTSIASIWRTLTDEQMQAWNAFASQSPRKNKVGDTYTMSGFNCFVQANSLRKKAGLETISYPPELSILPDVSSVEVNAPDVNQTFFPTYRKLTHSANAQDPTGVIIQTSNEPAGLSGPYMELIDVSWKPDWWSDWVNDGRGWCVSEFNDGITIELSAERVDSTHTVYIIALLENGIMVTSNDATVENDSNYLPNTLCLTVFTTGMAMATFYYDKKGGHVSVALNSLSTQITDHVKTTIFQPNVNADTTLPLVSYTLARGRLDHNETIQFLNGYNVAKNVIVLNSASITQINNTLSNRDGVTAQVDVIDDGDVIIGTTGPTNPPAQLITVSNVPQEPIGGIVRVSITPPMSNGRGGALNNYSICKDIVIDGSTEFDISDAFNTVKKYIPNNSAITFKTSPISKDYGSKAASIKIPKKKKIKFKAGSDLANTVY